MQVSCFYPCFVGAPEEDRYQPGGQVGDGDGNFRDVQAGRSLTRSRTCSRTASLTPGMDAGQRMLIHRASAAVRAVNLGPGPGQAGQAGLSSPERRWQR